MKNKKYKPKRYLKVRERLVGSLSFDIAEIWAFKVLQTAKNGNDDVSFFNQLGWNGYLRVSGHGLLRMAAPCCLREKRRGIQSKLKRVKYLPSWLLPKRCRLLWEEADHSSPHRRHCFNLKLPYQRTYTFKVSPKCRAGDGGGGGVFRRSAAAEGERDCGA